MANPPETERSLLAGALALAGAAYFVRFQLSDYLGFGRETGFSPGVALAFVVAVAAVPFGIVLLLRAYRFWDTRGRLVPLAVLVGAFLLVFFIPLPWTTEQRSFYEQRSAYEQVVELARRGELARTAECPAPAYAAPAGYEFLGADCLLTGSDRGMVVEFTPRSVFRPVVYFEDPAAIKTSLACVEPHGRTEFVLADNWYVCTRYTDPVPRP
jgi:hypothetical protein